MEGLGKSERVEGQELLLTAGGLADTLLIFGYIMNFMTVYEFLSLCINYFCN
jgi:hypothetical protein